MVLVAVTNANLMIMCFFSIYEVPFNLMALLNRHPSRPNAAYRNKSFVDTKR